MATRKLGRGVAVVGAGMTRFGAHLQQSNRDLLVEAFQAMRPSVDRGLDPRDIEAVYIGNFTSELFEHQGQIAPLLTDWLGLTPRPATRVEDACASGGVALRQGILAIASGLYDLVLVGGVEKMTHLPIQRVTDTLETAADELYETSAGFTFPGFYAAMATAYAAQYDEVAPALAEIAIKNHQNGALNPNAQFQTTLDAIMQKTRARRVEKGSADPAWPDVHAFLQDEHANPLIAYPLRLFDCSPITDGAACLLLAAEELAPNFSQTPVHIIGTGQASDGGLYARESLTTLKSARCAAQEAYQMADVTPDDIRMAEVHDCFTIAEVIAGEDLGFFAPGEGARAALEGQTRRDGAHPVNTSGGLKAKGHPVGATGIGQVVEVWKQMRGEAGERQLPRDVTLALTHNVGGTGQTAVVHIFERR